MQTAPPDLPPNVNPFPPAPPVPRVGRRQVFLLIALGGLVLGLSLGAAWLVRGWFNRPAPAAPDAETEPGTDRATRLARGKVLYQVYCTHCHGPEGHGDGSSAAGLKSPVPDFAAGPWKHGATPSAVRRVVADGVPGTAMPASGAALSATDLDAVAAYVLTLAP